MDLLDKSMPLLQDGTILAWKFNMATNSFEPAASLKGHSLAVVTLVVGANRLYSGSMDHSIRVWVATESGSLEVTYTHNEEHGLLTLCGLHDLDGKPILLCFCNDNSIRVYDLPSFLQNKRFDPIRVVLLDCFLLVMGLVK